MKKQEFTNREKFTKSLKFEAKPEEATMQAIKEQHLMEANSEMLEKAKELETFIDIVIKEIICKGLAHVTYDMDALCEKYVNASSDRKSYNEELQKLTDAILEKVTAYLPKGMRKINDINSAAFIKDVIPEIITHTNIPDSDKQRCLQLIDEMSSCGTLMDKFLITRTTAVTTWMPKRVIENFEIYMGNMVQVKRFLDEDPSAKDFMVDFPEVSSFACASFYEMCLTPDAISGYNLVISGKYNADGTLAVKGYNQYINELNTAHKHDADYNGCFYRTLKPLYQQILMPKPKLFTIDKLQNDDDLRLLLAETGEKVPKKALFDIVECIKNADKSGIVIDGTCLHTLSHIVYGNHNTIPSAFIEELSNSLEVELHNATKKSEIKALEKAIETVSTTVGSSIYTMSTVEMVLDDDTIFNTYIAYLQERLKNVIACTEALQEENILSKRKIFGRKEAKNVVKNYTQSLLDFRSAVKLIVPNKNNDMQDIIFYERLDKLCEPFAFCVRAYNLCRNYLTAAPRDLAEENIMCFGQSMMLSNTWWKTSFPKLKAGMCAILEKDNKYYYIIKSPLAKPVEILPCEEDNGYHMLSYLKGQDANKLFAKTVFSKEVKSAFLDESIDEVNHPFIAGLTVTREQYAYYLAKTYSLDSVRKGKATEGERLHALATMIDLYKSVIPLYTSTACFDFNLKPTEEYNDIGLFMDDCNRFMTKASWVNVSKDQIDAAINSGSLLSFLITNLNMYKEGKEKTTYAQTFLYMMSEENLKAMNFRLNAKPMMTFRPACLPLDITHPKGSILVNKYDTLGRKIPGNAYVELLNYYNGKLSEKDLAKETLSYIPYSKTRVADFDIAKNFTYMQDKFLISFSYSANADIPDRNRNTISEEVAEEVKKGCKVLSVVRGTSDMLYYVLYDEDRNIIEKRSLNIIGDTDYCSLLRQLTMENRQEQADNWNTPIKVTKIKESYVNFAISEIMQVAVKNNAVIVIEKLDEHFKDKMSLVDNQVYKIFETKLKSRLLDYRNKKIPLGEPGSISTPLQFCKKVIGNPMQNGILFEINGAYTKNMDATTGFIDLFNWNNLNTVSSKRAFLQKFDSITINENKVEYSFDYRNFALRNGIDGDNLKKSDWTVYAGKPCTIYDGFTYKLDNAPAKDVIKKFVVNDLEEASNEVIKMLFDLFKKTLKISSVKQCQENEREYYSSPVAPTDEFAISSAENAARNLANKMFCFQDRIENDSDFTEEWLNYVV